MGGGIVGKVIPRPQRTATVNTYLPAIVSGLGVTLKHFFKNTKEMVFGQRNDPVTEAFDDGITTISYPEQKRPYPERFRGLHRLTLREDGSPRCVACLCCSTACPAQCIHITAGEYPPGDKRRGYERYPVEFVIDELRCIFCGYCVEACPCDAIRMDTGQHAVPYDSREQFIYKRETLMSFANADGKQLSDNPRQEPAEGHTPTRLLKHLSNSGGPEGRGDGRGLRLFWPADRAADMAATMLVGLRRGAMALVVAAVLPLSVWSCGKTDDKAPALSKPAAAASAALKGPAFASSASPGVVPCGSAACPVTKSARKVCCNAPGVPPMCRSADRCGQASQFRYSGMLSCNETADCKGIEPGRDVVCCITDDGFRADAVPGPYNRAGCVPRAACTGKDVLACTSDAECPKGTRCQGIQMGSGVQIGGCLP